MKYIQRNLALLLGAVLLPALATAQGSDSCAGAQAINGAGTFSFNNGSATTDGATDPLCNAFGSSQIDSDVWFAWTAPATDNFTIDTCGGTGVDTKIAAYAGTSCSTGAPLDCNDDDCGLQSSIAFAATSGSTYLLRIGTFPGASGGAGSFNVTQGGATTGCDNPTTGPDVIVGLLNGLSNYGGVGGIGGYSIGTDSCNIGDDELNWISGNPNHPVIAQNMYRLEDGRFEQVGLSWLKHGFTALQLDLCCDCTSSGTGTRLGVGCSDPYGSGLNGSQGGLGPRFEVDAHSGVFSYPFFAQNQTGNAIYKRIQIANSDLDPALHPTAEYFGEAQYIAPDDALAGNANNNTSYMPAQVDNFNGGAWRMSLFGFTHREDPAIQAWQDQDPNVQLEHVQVPNEGLFIVGSNCTDNGDGTWHYEYAVYNMNSDVSGGGFSVPVSDNVAVTNIGFHDVDHHSGEPFDGIDWVGSHASNTVSWATDSFAVNANANAIRWGTLTNFRFDANSAPEPSSATLTLYKPHTPSSVAVSVCGPDGDPVGCTGNIASYCSSTQNTSGQNALITAVGSTSIAANNLTLAASQMPVGKFGYFLMSNTQGFFPNLGGGDGNFCLGAPFVRFASFITQVDALGQLNLTLDMTSLPSGTVFMPGDQWNFQAWFRDSPSNNSNTSDGVAVDLCP